MHNVKRLETISDIRQYFYQDKTPTYFIGATNFNLIGMDDWVRNFRYITLIDSFDSRHPHVMIPAIKSAEEFESIEAINNYLLNQADVIKRMKEDRVGMKHKSKALFLFFDGETEKQCKKLGLKLCFPTSKLRKQIDNKIVTTRLAKKAGVESVPNVLAKVKSFKHICGLAKRYDLGEDWVVQTAYGDSGQTTYFIANEGDYNKYKSSIEAQDTVKIMKRIDCKGSAIEACITKHGTLVGPLMPELIGFKELTPYKGGWCGNQIMANTYSEEVRRNVLDKVKKLGAQLLKMGYKGYFEVDFLIEDKTDKLYLGEINPRISGASAMTNLSALAHADVPLFLFHLLEFSRVEYTLNVDALNERWLNQNLIDDWSQLVMKDTDPRLKLLMDVPQTGIWEMKPDGTLMFVRPEVHRKFIKNQNQGFFFRIAERGNYSKKGSDMGILFLPGKTISERGHLLKRTKRWIDGMHAQFDFSDVNQERVFYERPQVGGFKGG